MVSVTPVVTAKKSSTFLPANDTHTVSDLFTVSGSPAYYRFYVTNANSAGGELRINGVAQPARTIVTVAAADLASVTFYMPYATGGSAYQDLHISASTDGTTYGRDASVYLVPDHAPTAFNGSAVRVARGAVADASVGLFNNYTDVDGDTATQYRVYDTNGAANSGYFTFTNHYYTIGVDTDPTHETVTVNARQTYILFADEAASLKYHASSTASVSDNLLYSVFDGRTWSNQATTYFVNTAANTAPTITGGGVFRPTGGTVISGAALIGTYSDVDGQAAASYRFYDTNVAGGDFYLNGVAVTARTTITVNAADLANIEFRTLVGGSVDTLLVQASDGYALSNQPSVYVAATA